METRVAMGVFCGVSYLVTTSVGSGGALVILERQAVFVGSGPE